MAWAVTAAREKKLSPELVRLLTSTSIVMATILQTLDSTIANVALPHMQGAMNASLEQISWMLTAYMVATAVFMPLIGFAERRLGRKRLFLASVIGFTTASFKCGTATSLVEIVGWRFVQGAAGAAIIPLCQTILLDLYPPSQRGPAMALWGIGVMIGPILGPTLGGYLTDEFNWRWVFFINVPIGIVSAIGIARFLDDTPVDRTHRFDWTGFVSLTVALCALQIMLDRGQHRDWFESTEIVIELLIACAAFWIFLVHTLTAERPLISPRAFRDINFAIGQVIMFLLGVVLLATMTLLPTFLQTLLGYPVQDAGWLLAPRGLGTMLGMLMIGRLTQFVSPHRVIGIGVVLMAGSLWQMSGFTFDTGFTEIVISCIIQGFGIGFVFVPLSLVTFHTLEPKYRTEGASIFGLVRNVGGSIGLSVVVSYLARMTQANHAVLTEHVTPFAPAAEIAARSMADLDAAYFPLIEVEVSRQAAMLAYIQDFELMALALVAALPLLLLLRAPSKAPT